jgi:putative transposase
MKVLALRRRLCGMFPYPAALLRLAGSVLVEAHDEWQVADKRYLPETTLALLNQSSGLPQPSVTAPATLTA